MSKDPDAPPTYEEAVQPTSHSPTSPPPTLPPYGGEGYQPVPSTVPVTPGVSTPGYTPAGQYPPYPPQPYPAPAQPYPAPTPSYPTPAQPYPAPPYSSQHLPTNKYNTQSTTARVIITPQLINRGELDQDDTLQYRNVGILSMITCLFCCCPFGSIALYKVYQSNEYARMGERQLAILNLKSAQKWALLGIIIGIATYIMLSVRNMLAR